MRFRQCFPRSDARSLTRNIGRFRTCRHHPRHVRFEQRARAAAARWCRPLSARTFCHGAPAASLETPRADEIVRVASPGDFRPCDSAESGKVSAAGVLPREPPRPNVRSGPRTTGTTPKWLQERAAHATPLLLSSSFLRDSLPIVDLGADWRNAMGFAFPAVICPAKYVSGLHHRHHRRRRRRWSYY